MRFYQLPDPLYGYDGNWRFRAMASKGKNGQERDSTPDDEKLVDGKFDSPPEELRDPP